MDAFEFVQNIKKYCSIKGVKPTVACRESGVGTSFINNIEKRGSMPSIEKVQMLAEYLGVTVSELLGEKPPTGQLASGQEMEFARLFAQLSSDQQALVLAQLQGIVAAKEKQSAPPE
ncbi:helix-turn-helix domain-containing protein [uncultured Flavonifractor sp.]|uniref:helix-turn-helix domain-containing protein n=1 Tax=uncultured Flavonifractor sp. TaxID=1193534 RepID=UPI0026055E43|nr:helix-turn-helix transcriptional regulator [uncultured Flavonifractor sp.]